MITLVSSANTDELEAYKEIANVADLIEKQTSTDEAEKSKPYPDIFQTALEKLKVVGAGKTIIIGDTAYGAEATTAAKINVFGF